MDIGAPVREIEVEPLVEPVPQPVEVPERIEEPDREKIPA